MTQILHVFRKDVRHHWIEIAFCQVALALFSWNEVSEWSRRTVATGPMSWGFWAGAMLPLSWCFLVFRTVQGESMVGDRQFWITRPYDWKKLLAAKALLVVVFINVPLLVSGAFLLGKAGFSPLPHLFGLLWMQLLLIQIPLLPMAALAAVTRTLGQVLLALLAVLLYLAGMVALSEVIENGQFSSADTDYLQGLILLLATVVALWLQYSRRRTILARAWLAGGAAAITIVMVASTYLSHEERSYAVATGPAQTIQAVLARARLEPPHDAPDKDEDVEIALPMVIWGVPPNSVGRLRRVRLTLEAPNRTRWQSKWEYNSDLLGPRENYGRQEFKMQYKTYQTLRDFPLKARISLAVALFRQGESKEVAATRGEFTVPNVGRCAIDSKSDSQVRCHSPLVQPALVVASVDPATSTCPIEDNDQDDAGSANSLAQPYDVVSSDEQIAEYGFSPVQTFHFYLSHGASPAHICPGTPLSFSFPKPVGRTRVEFEADDIRLDDLRLENFLRHLVVTFDRRSK